ncbi:glycosyltransferase family 2 protein [Natrinema sp. LN54]|uniref:glycosyltransferase family 2 protein n=1 Tax=Natrinema sp. LN54 TaxID=3458705 RepID=UPI00403653FE
MTDTAVCIPVFTRVKKVSDLFNSVEREGLEKVYIADDGEMTDEKRDLYSRDFDFELEVFDLEYDAGVGEKRRILAERPDEDYLLFVDSDMEVPSNYELLERQLEARPDIGFLGGMYLEKDRLYTVASDLFIEDNVLYRDIREVKEMETVAGSPLVEFDFLPQVGLLRKECAEDYNWDGEYTIMREHIDFFVGHWEHTDWTIALSPSVFFPHYPGGDQEFMSNRHSERKFEESDEYFCEKWGVKEFKKGNALWVDTYQPIENMGKLEHFAEICRNHGPIEAIQRTISFLYRKMG